MKKLLAVLLALAVVGGFAFAQGKVSVGLDGTYTLINQDIQGVAGYNGNTGATDLSIAGSDEKGTKGVDLHIGDAAVTAGAFAVDEFDAWFKMFNDVVTLKFGNWSNCDFETSGPFKYDFGYLGASNKLEVQVYPVAGLTVYADLAYTKNATDLVNILEDTDLYASYAIDKVGKVTAWALLDLVNDSNEFGGAFKFTGVENLSATVSVDYATALNLGVWASYTVGAFTPKVEFDLVGTAWNAYAYCKYTANANISAAVTGYFDSTNAYFASASATYAFGNGVSIGASAKYADGYDNATKNGFFWSIPLKFSVAF